MKKIIAVCLFIILPVVAACQNTEKNEQEKQVEVTENTNAKGGWGIESKDSPF